MKQGPCDVCGSAASIRLASIQAWLCAACATTILRERRLSTRRLRGRAVLSAAPPAIRRTESRYRNNVLLN